MSKPMVPVLDRPLMEHLLRLLRRHGFTDLAANLHYQPFDMPQRFDDGAAAGVSLRYQFELQLSGTAGGTGLFRDFLGDGTFLVMSGDALTDIDLTSLVAHHRASGCAATIAVKTITDPSRYGVVVTDELHRVRAFQEKPQPEEALSHLCSCGIYVFEPRIFDYIPPGKFVDYAADVFPALLADGVPVGTWPLESYWSDVGDLDAYRQANFDALAGEAGVSSNVRSRDPASGWAGSPGRLQGGPTAAGAAGPRLPGRGRRQRDRTGQPGRQLHRRRTRHRRRLRPLAALQGPAPPSAAPSSAQACSWAKERTWPGRGHRRGLPALRRHDCSWTRAPHGAGHRLGPAEGVC